MELQFIDTSQPIEEVKEGQGFVAENTDFDDQDFTATPQDQSPYDDFLEIAKGMNFTDDDLKSIPKEITKDDYAKYMKELFGRQYLNEKAPGLAPVIDEGIDMYQYMEQVRSIDDTLAFPDENLVKGTLYDHYYKEAIKFGTISPDQNGNISKEDMNYIVSKVEADYQRYGDKVYDVANSIREHLEMQKQQLPSMLRDQSIKQYENMTTKYQAEVQEFVKELAREKEIILSFADQKEKDDFINFANSQMSIVETEGQKGVKLIMDLENDPVYLKKVLRLLHLDKMGYIKDIKTKASVDAWSKLGKHGQEKGPSFNKQGGFVFVDTSKPH